jgi:hypothetical protein
MAEPPNGGTGICPACDRYHHWTAPYGTPRCDAFPSGIPIDVVLGRLDHHAPVPGDGGRRFLPVAPRPPATSALRFVDVVELHRRRSDGGAEVAARFVDALDGQLDVVEVAAGGAVLADGLLAEGVPSPTGLLTRGDGGAVLGALARATQGSRIWASPVFSLEHGHAYLPAPAADLEVPGFTVDERLGLVDALRHRGTADVAERFVARCPRHPVARCPFTGDVLQLPVDDVGFDSPFWDAERPLRPRLEAPATWITSTGAVALRGAVPNWPALVAPGPSVPAVLPRLLADAAVVAVLSSITVGRDPAWVVSYFRSPDALGEPGTADLWGTRAAPDGRRAPVAAAELDADLGRWLADGRLRWIAPGDVTAALREGNAGCPYLGLGTDTRLIVVRNGVADRVDRLP